MNHPKPTPARRRMVMITLALVAIGAGLVYGLAPTPAFSLLATIVCAGTALALGALAMIDPHRPRRGQRNTDSVPFPFADAETDPWSTSTGQAVLDHMRITNPWLAAKIERGGRDVVPETPAGITNPSGAEAGYLAGLEIYGPGITVEGTIYVRREPGGWDHPGFPAPMCLECDEVQGLWLMWLDSHPDLARLICPCGASWFHANWGSSHGVMWALAQDPEDPREHQEQHFSPDADPLLAYWAQMIRREAGNPGRGRNR